MWCVRREGCVVCEEGGVCGVCVRERGGENVTCTMNIKVCV